MDRRGFLTAVGLAALSVGLGAGAVQGGILTRSALDRQPTFPRTLADPRLRPHVLAPAQDLPTYFPRPNLTRVPIPGGSITALPGEGNLVAFTIDDGVSSEVVGAYAELAKRTGLRFTFFITAAYSSWTEHASAIRPLVESGQVQVANHTWSHPSLTAIGDDAIRRELGRCGDFISSTYGVEAAPYFRPPYGNYDGRVLAAASSVGYRQAVLWYGSVGDSGSITDADMSRLIQTWFTAQRIVIGHANQPTVLRHFEEIIDVIVARGLQPVTLDDVFARD